MKTLKPGLPTLPAIWPIGAQATCEDCGCEMEVESKRDYAPYGREGVLYDHRRILLYCPSCKGAAIIYKDPTP